MLQSKLFGKIFHKDPKDETSINAKLLIRGGFISKEMSGVYNFLPLGLKILNKITDIVRDEMEKAGGHELLMSALQNKANWETTGRWDTFDALFKIKSRHKSEYALGPTHEEVLVPIAKQFINSYKDLPKYIFQIQTKFRDEVRAKSGILRGREFLMKDLYSFHTDKDDADQYYKRMKKAYVAVFKKCGLEAIETEASGGAFCDFSHEYQVLTADGEDIIFYCENKDFAQNSEISKLKEGEKCQKCNGKILKGKSIEVGNIFPLKDRFSKAFGLTFKDQDGKEKNVMMGCYGIGISRLMGSVVEVHHDDKGIIWPENIAPFCTHLICLSEDPKAKNYAKKLYKKLLDSGADVLYDDRNGKSAGERFADSDILGIPFRVVISDKTMKESKVEVKQRKDKNGKLISEKELF
ncbi:proline--tRNA ligase [Patescibacteria group bacterium]